VIILILEKKDKVDYYLKELFRRILEFFFR